MLSINIVVILIELIIWVFLFLKFSKDMSYYRAILFSDFVITTIDFVLLFTPLRSTIITLYVINRKANKVILSIPVTFGMILLVKSGIFYLGQEFFPEWMKRLRRMPSHSGEIEYEQEERRRNILS